MWFSWSVLDWQVFCLIFQIVCITIQVVVFAATRRNLRRARRHIAIMGQQTAQVEALAAASEQLTVLLLALWRLTLVRHR